ncbi:PilZ domain-containing protein [Croceicoccus bisphenolivorans]|uniref:PilZ domain-containing protein n=1 Tax=Croceicoccus bisphenolivorans TaxID=1783232 RepID=UPI0009ECED7F|nr:PilZ domain-containing protein [Croceicoccus bisphenolivorans]
MAYHQHSDFQEIVERRREDDPRTQTVYRPCALEIAENLYPGLLRNISEHGAQIDVFHDLEVGDMVIYDDGVRGAIEGHVLWREGDRYGIRNSEKASVYTSRYFERGNAYRSIRIPIELASTTWIRGSANPFVISNISLSGAQISGAVPNGAEVGELCTVRIGKVGDISCSIRWIDNGCFGVKFSRLLTVRELTELLVINDAGNSRKFEPSS